MAMGWISATKKSGVVKRQAMPAIEMQIKPALVEVNGDLRNYNVHTQGAKESFASPDNLFYGKSLMVKLLYHLIRFAI